MSRSFTIEHVQKINGSNVNYTGGRFKSEIPSSSASKMFSHIYHYLGATGPLSLKITLRETTQGSLKKLYSYKVSKIVDKVSVEHDGVIVHYNFSTKVKTIW